MKPQPATRPGLLLASVVVVATCGLVYELIAGTLASYLLGDSVTQFSTVIGVYMFAMGIGSFLSSKVERDPLAFFIRAEILLGLVGGFSAAALFLLFDQVLSFRIPLYATVIMVGTLAGIEIPLLIRILRDHFEFKDLVARVLTFDYIGALFASLLFPLILVPHLGLIRSSFLFGILNVAVALWLLSALRHELASPRRDYAFALVSLTVLTAGFIFSDQILSWSEAALYTDPVVYARSTPYQRIILTASRRETRLFLNGNLQFSSRDEYRYHEALVHPALSGVDNPSRVLIFGGGDGLAAREVLKWPAVTSITQIELDPAVVKLFSRNSLLSELNQNSFTSPRLHLTIQDAFVWLKEQEALGNPLQFDFVVVDFPDPSNYSIGKLYSLSFFRLLKHVVAPGGAIVVQSTSPYVARRSFWCVVATLEAAGFTTLPYHVYVPSFGEWGFVAAAPGGKPPETTKSYPPDLRYVSAETVANMRYFPPDMGRVPAEVNRLDSQALVRYFEAEWAEYGVN